MLSKILKGWKGRDDIKIEQTYPPNYKQICDRFPVVKTIPDAVFVYGNIIHNAHKIELFDHVIIHETVHCYQQGDDPEGWYDKYFNDREFRLTQEVEAYGMQYAFILEQTRDRNVRASLLFELAGKLRDPMYEFGLSYMECELKIKRMAKRKSS